MTVMMTDCGGGDTAKDASGGWLGAKDARLDDGAEGDREWRPTTLTHTAKGRD